MARIKKIDDYLDIIIAALESPNFNESQFFKLVIDVLLDFSQNRTQFEYEDEVVEPAEPEPASTPAPYVPPVVEAIQPEPEPAADHWQAWETELPPEPSPPPVAQPQAAPPIPTAPVVYATEAAQSVGVLHAADISTNNSRIAMENLNGGGITENSPNLDASNRFTNSFDEGLENFDHIWGDVKHGVTASGDGYIELTSPADTHESASAMIAPNGADSGFGYGLYSFTLNVPTEQAVVGPYALLWPATDTWPGPERDVFEIGGSEGATLGKPYSAAHGNNNGNDIYTYEVMPDSIDPRDIHTYSIDWQQDSLTYYVDGRSYHTVTDPIFLKPDFENGGENAAPGVGQLTHHWRDQNTVDNVIRLYEFNYIPNQDVFA